MRVHKVHLCLDSFFDIVIKFKLINLIDAMLRIAPQESEYGTEWNSGIHGKLLDWQAFLVKEIRIGRINQLDGSLVVELLEHYQICFNHACLLIKFI